MDFVASKRCSERILLMQPMLWYVWEATCLADRPAERREMIWALESAEMAFMAVVVENKGLFGFVCSMLSF